MCSVNFWYRQDSNTVFKGGIGPLSASGLLSCVADAAVKLFWFVFVLNS